jgi:hypothetical protein
MDTLLSMQSKFVTIMNGDVLVRLCLPIYGQESLELYYPTSTAGSAIIN